MRDLSMSLKHFCTSQSVIDINKFESSGPKTRAFFFYFIFCFMSISIRESSTVRCLWPLQLPFLSGYSQCQAWGESSDCRTNSKA